MKATAYHEAGHAVVAWSSGLLRRRGVTIVPDSECYGQTYLRVVLGERPDVAKSDRGRIRAEKLAEAMLAGMEAQRKYNPRSLRKYHGHQDYRNVVDLMDYYSGSTEELNQYLKLLRIRAAQTVEQFWAIIEKVAAQLHLRKTLSGPEVQQIIQRVLALHGPGL